MPLSDAGKNVALDAIADVALYASLHDGDPGSTGANELTGGSPAYARKAVTWNAASNGNLDADAIGPFDVPAGDVTHWGLWSAATSGTFYGGGAVSTPETYASQGTFTLQDADIDLEDPA